MEVINVQTRKKIEELKEDIKNRVPVKDIIKIKFGSQNKKNKWFEKNHEYFSHEELEYMSFSISDVEIVEEAKEEQQEERKENALTIYENIKGLSQSERLKLITSDEVLSFIYELKQERAEGRKKGFKVPEEYLKITDLKVKNCRLSDSIYKKFTQFCESKGYTITSVMNYILDEFVKNNK